MLIAEDESVDKRDIGVTILSNAKVRTTKEVDVYGLESELVWSCSDCEGGIK